mgnify:CR=1 FL=1
MTETENSSSFPTLSGASEIWNSVLPSADSSWNTKRFDPGTRDPCREGLLTQKSAPTKKPRKTGAFLLQAGMWPRLFLRSQPGVPSDHESLRTSLYRLQQGIWILHLRLRRNDKKHLHHFPAQENRTPCCHWTILPFHLPFACFLLILSVVFAGMITESFHFNSSVKQMSSTIYLLF